MEDGKSSTRPTFKVLVLHGAGLTMRGKAQIQKFGPLTLADYEKAILGYVKEINDSQKSAFHMEVEFFQSNSEGDHIDRLYAAHDDSSIIAAVINPGAFMRGYRALGIACEQVRFPVYEVHISNPANAGVISEIASAVKGTIAGCGVFGYGLALQTISHIPLHEATPPKEGTPHSS